MNLSRWQYIERILIWAAVFTLIELLFPPALGLLLMGGAIFLWMAVDIWAAGPDWPEDDEGEDAVAESQSKVDLREQREEIDRAVGEQAALRLVTVRAEAHEDQRSLDWDNARRHREAGH